MAKGRKATPTALKLLTGNPGRRPLNEKEPAYAPLSGPPPKWLGKDERKYWKDVSALLSGSRVLTEADQPALTALCIALGQLQDAAITLREEGKYYQINDLVKVHPAASQLWQSMSIVKGLLAEFGMTPASRSKVIASTGAEEEDPAEEYLKGGK